MGVRYLMRVHTECVCVLLGGEEVSRVVIAADTPQLVRAGESVSISVHRFAPTPAAKIGLADTVFLEFRRGR